MHDAFSLLLVLGWERLFKMGERWQLDHRLEPFSVSAAIFPSGAPSA